MAKIIRRIARPHPCAAELAEVDTTDLGPGSIAECSCGNQFEWTDDQRDGLHWSRLLRRVTS